MPMPPQPLGWFNEPIESAEQLNGLKYRTVGLAADLFQSMGAAVTQLPGGELIPAMERGVLDAFEYNNPTSDRRFGAQDVADNYMMGSYHQANETFEFIFNRDMFEDLPAELQAILEYGVEASATANYSKAMDLYSADLQGLINEDGVNVLRTPDSIMQAQLDAWDKVLAKHLLRDAGIPTPEHCCAVPLPVVVRRSTDALVKPQGKICLRPGRHVQRHCLSGRYQCSYVFLHGCVRHRSRCWWWRFPPSSWVRPCGCFAGARWSSA